MFSPCRKCLVSGCCRKDEYDCYLLFKYIKRKEKWKRIIPGICSIIIRICILTIVISGLIIGFSIVISGLIIGFCLLVFIIESYEGG